MKIKGWYGTNNNFATSKIWLPTIPSTNFNLNEKGMLRHEIDYCTRRNVIYTFG